MSALVCLAAVVAAGCHGQGNISYYGTAWVDVSDEPGDFTSYIVTIDSVTLTRSDGYVIEAVGTPEIVDLTQVHNIAELWSSGSIPDGTYTSATITMDYTPVPSGGSSVISVMVNGQPQAANVLDAVTGTTPTTYSITTNFDPANLPTITPTYASTSAVLLSIGFDLAATGVVDLSTSPATFRVRPYVTIGMQAPDRKLIRVRGPLINSSTDVNTYTVYIRPFYDEANNLGSLTLFSQPNTVYTLNGKTYVGKDGLQPLSVLSAGTTVTAGYTTFQPDYNPANGATAGRFNLVYAVAGSTLEDIYTEGVSGDVIARDGNTVTLLGATLFLNTADQFFYCGVTDLASLCTKGAQVLLGPGTIVTADNNSTLTQLNSSAVSVGQHITARGVCVNNCTGPTVELDATGTSATNTGSVRLQNTEVWGSLVSSPSGSVTLDAQTIDNWPIADFNFTGNGTAAESPAAFLIDSGAIPLPAGTTAGDPLWVSGYTTPFGTAPPDFNALAVNNEASVQIAGGQIGGGAATTPGNGGCGIGSQVCDPANLQITWKSSPTPFATLSDAGFSLNLDLAVTAQIKIGPEVINLVGAPAITVVPTALAVTNTFAPRYSVGDPSTATITPTVGTATTAIASYSSFSSWVSQVNSTLSSTPGLQLSATGIYDRATNTFTATSIDLVL
ncbi:MAG TPA: hypothetical protein VGL87_14815 [Steroidobacteraceae bacterium]